MGKQKAGITGQQVKGPLTSAFVISDVLGQKAGAYLATWLLCRELARLGLRVTCLAQYVDLGGGLQDYGTTGPRDQGTTRSRDHGTTGPWGRPTGSGFEIVRPWVRRGCRWDWPGRCLAWQACRRIRNEQPGSVFVVGMTPLAKYLLQTDVADQLLVWELTNANPGNKFVDEGAQKLLGRARAVLSPSATIDRIIRETYGYQGRILRLPFWVEEGTTGLQDYGTTRPQGDSFTTDFIYLGRRDVEKGLRELIAATAIVARQYPDVRVLIAGQGSEEPFASQARELGIAQNVDFRFFPTRQETMDALANSCCLVLPSYHEGYPLVLLEAAQLGVPFIATRVGSVAEVFEETGAGLIVPPRDEKALAEAMLAMLAEPPEAYCARRATAQQVFRRVSSRAVVEASLRRVLDMGLTTKE